MLLSVSEPPSSAVGDHLDGLAEPAGIDAIGAGQALKVLVVDDDASLRILVSAMVRELGYEVVSASNGVDALEQIATSPPSIIISDCNMPGMDGWELCQRVRERDTGCYIYIIMLTSADQGEAYDSSMEAGADDFTRKPVSKAKLRLRLKAASRIITLDRGLRDQNEKLRHAYREQSKDLHAAGALQRDMLPPNRDYSDYRFMSRNLPATEISGDSQNHFLLPDRQIFFFQADAVGHGLRAALLSVSLVRMLELKFCAPNNTTLAPGTIVSRLNHRLQSDADPIEYFTILTGVLRPETGELKFCQAGHPSPFVHRQCGRVDRMGDGGLPVSLFPEASYRTETLKLEPGDRLWIVSDGVTEALNAKNEQYADERIAKLLTEIGDKTMEEQVDIMVRSLTNWSAPQGQNDDISIMAIERCWRQS